MILGIVPTDTGDAFTQQAAEPVSTAVRRQFHGCTMQEESPPPYEAASCRHASCNSSYITGRSCPFRSFGLLQTVDLMKIGP